jgi:hypothetical protein
MGFALVDTAWATSYAQTVSTASAITVSAGDLIVIGWGSLASSCDPSTVYDSLGNDYSLLSSLDSGNDSTLCVAWCVSAESGSLTATGNIAGAASQRVYITVVVMRPDAGDTVSMDDFGYLQTSWDSPPYTTSEFDATQDDSVVVGFAATSGSTTTWNDPEVPAGTDANQVNSYGAFGAFYQILTAAASGLEAKMTASASGGVSMEGVSFKSVGGGAPAGKYQWRGIGRGLARGVLR